MLKKIIFSLTLFVTFFGTHIVQAQGLLPAAKNGNYGLNDFIVLAANVSRLMLGLIGSVVLLMFIYGGFTMITAGSGGAWGRDNKSKVNKGKQILTAAIVGLLIVFTSYLIIKFVLSSFGIDWNGEIKVLNSTSAQQINS